MKFFCIPLFTCKNGIVETLDYSQLRLEEVPKEILKSRKFVEELLLNVNGIEELPHEFFRCTKLRKLDISENKIKVLPPEIGALQMLMDLNLSKNEFVELPEEIGECRSLMSLNVSTNIVPGLPKSIVNLTSLTHLNISNNSLTQLPSDIDQLVSLQCLDIGQCELRFLPQSIVRLCNLKILDLCENYLTELPSSMEGLVSLEILDVHNNMISYLPDDILHCQSLRNLDVSCNNLCELPADLGDLENLTELSACDNQLSIIPSSIGRLKKLEILKVSKNRISELTPAICSCFLLTDLILCENQLSELPSSLGNLKRLKFLDVNVNNLRHIPTTIGGCSSLGVLTLRHNQVQELPMEIGRLSKLQVLDVIDNNLTYLPYTLTVLYQSKSLSALWLSFNQPPLPKLSVANEPVMNVKVLTCYLLPQKGDNRQISSYNSAINKSCVGGARVCFAKEWTQSGDFPSTVGNGDDDDDEEKNIPIGRFERYDTPHPKPFAPKNRAARNSGDFSNNVVTSTNPTDGIEAQPDLASSNKNAQQNVPVEMRPLRSVLKRRPQSILSQQALALAAAVSNDDEDDANYEQQKITVVKRSLNDGFGWHIVGGADSMPYKGKFGVFISQLNEDGLAKRSGFCVDDRIVSVNGIEIDSSLSHEQAIQIIKTGGNQLDVIVERKSNIHPAATVHKEPCSPSVCPPSPPNTLKLPLAEMDNDSEDDQETPKTAKASSEIIAITIGRDRAPGFSVQGTGTTDDPVVISALTPGGAAERSGKLRVGDHLLSLNGVNMKSASHDQVVTLITANMNSDIYLIVERINNCNKNLLTEFGNNLNVASGNKSTTLSNYSVEPTRRIVVPSQNSKLFGTTAGTNLAHSRSLPSLAQAVSPPLIESVAPPIPPRTDLITLRNNSLRQQRGIAPNRSMNNLLFETTQRAFSPNFALPPISNTMNATTAFNSVAIESKNSTVSPSKLPKKVPLPPTKCISKMDHLTSDNFGHILNFEAPLATSSPIPKVVLVPSHIPILKTVPHATTSLSSSIPQFVAPSLGNKVNVTSSLPQCESTSKIPPPPVAPKPKLILEQLNFSSKIRRFEEEINAHHSGNKFNAMNGSSDSRKGGIPMKKPLVSSQDLEKFRAEEASKQKEVIVEVNEDFDTKEFESINEISDDACFNLLLKNGGTSLSSMTGPAVIRTRNAEIRAEKIAAAKALTEKNGTSLNESGVTSPLPSLSHDESNFSRASSSMSSLEQRAADLEKRQAWRQARLQSMADESKRTDDVIKKLITSIPSSPIPIQ